MTTAPFRQSPGGKVTLHVDRLSGVDPNSVTYSVSFTAEAAMSAVLLGRVQGLGALRDWLQKLNVSPPAVETACSALTQRTSHDIQGVNITPSLIRELGL